MNPSAPCMKAPCNGRVCPESLNNVELELSHLLSVEFTSDVRRIMTHMRRPAQLQINMMTTQNRSPALGVGLNIMITLYSLFGGWGWTMSEWMWVNVDDMCSSPLPTVFFFLLLSACLRKKEARLFNPNLQLPLFQYCSTCLYFHTRFLSFLLTHSTLLSLPFIKGSKKIPFPL